MNGNDTGTTQVSMREILTVIFRRKIPILIVSVVVAAAALTAASRTTSVYEGTARVLLRRSGATPLAVTWTPFYGLEEEMNTEVELITTEVVMERAVDLLKDRGIFIHESVGDSLVAREPTMRDIAAGISAVPVEMSNIILIQYVGYDPRFVGHAANAVADAYVEYRIQVRKTGSLQGFFSDQLTTIEERLLQLREQELALRKEGEIYNLEWQYQTAINRRNEILETLSEVRSRRKAEEQKLENMRRRMQEDPDLLVPFANFAKDKIGGEMLGEYWRLRSEHDELAAQLTESNPHVKMINDRIEMIEGRFREEIGRRMKEHEFLVEDLKAEEGALVAAAAEISAELRRTPDVVAQIAHLEKEIHYTYEHYEKVLEKILDTMASEVNDIRISNAKVISTAQAQLTKAGRMQTVYVAFSILLGVTLGVGFGFLLENLDHSVKSATDIEDHVGLPLLGSVPASRRLAQLTGRVDRTFSKSS
jgi:uncharacterized protein involved in exopolysaccharide biosynthesis